MIPFFFAPKKVVVGMDVASSEFLMPDGRYDLDFKNKGGNQQLTGEELGQLYKDLAAKYPIVSIEDPFDQVCWSWWHIYIFFFLFSFFPRAQYGWQLKACMCMAEYVRRKSVRVLIILVLFLESFFV